MNKTKYIEGKIYKKDCLFCDKPMKVKAIKHPDLGVGVRGACRKCQKRFNEEIIGKANKIINNKLTKGGL